MRYPILTNKKAGLKEFIEFWSFLYSDPRQDLYENAIEHKRFTADDIFKLYEWKNGGPLSERKRESVKNNVVKKLDLVNQFKQKMDIEAFDKSFGKMTSIWKIFLQHIIVPKTYPIFDQHVFRTYSYLTKGKAVELVDNDKVKNAVYAEYVLFFHGILKEGINYRKADKALWTFGKFLKSDYAECL